jgi:chromosome segregation ATPase
MFRQCCVLIGLVAMIGSLAAADGKKGKRNTSKNDRAAAMKARQAQATIQAAERQIAAAKRVLAAAESSSKEAKGDLAAALKKLNEASDEFRDAQSTSRHLAKDLAEIEQEILDENKDAPAFPAATKAVESARAELQSVEQRILAEPSVRAILAGLSDMQLANVKRTTLEARSEYTAARAKLEAAAEALGQRRRQLFESDPDWKEASEALAMARKEEQEAQEKTRASGAGRTDASETIRDSADAAAQARATITRAEAVIKTAERQAKAAQQQAKNKNAAKNKNKR